MNKIIDDNIVCSNLICSITMIDTSEISTILFFAKHLLLSASPQHLPYYWWPRTPESF